MQIKSGSIKKDKLILSGHRLGRFKGDFTLITTFLNASNYIIVSVPYENKMDSVGITHIYRLLYIEPSILQITGKFESRGSSHIHTNKYNVEISVRPTMSWQVWWSVPLNQILSNASRKIIIN